jgi:hypothetical protein
LNRNKIKRAKTILNYESLRGRREREGRKERKRRRENKIKQFWQ